MGNITPSDETVKRVVELMRVGAVSLAEAARLSGESADEIRDIYGEGEVAVGVYKADILLDYLPPELIRGAIRAELNGDFHGGVLDPTPTLTERMAADLYAGVEASNGYVTLRRSHLLPDRVVFVSGVAPPGRGRGYISHPSGFTKPEAANLLRDIASGEVASITGYPRDGFDSDAFYLNADSEGKAYIFNLLRSAELIDAGFTEADFPFHHGGIAPSTTVDLPTSFGVSETLEEAIAHAKNILSAFGANFEAGLENSELSRLAKRDAVRFSGENDARATIPGVDMTRAAVLKHADGMTSADARGLSEDFPDGSPMRSYWSSLAALIEELERLAKLDAASDDNSAGEAEEIRLRH